MSVITAISPKTEDVIARYQRAAPVKVIKLAHDLGLRVFAADLGPKISGKLYRDESSSSGWSITVNRGEAKVRRRFTTAHEIGHFLLHKDLVSDSLIDDAFYRSNLSNKTEAEANAFAADLLMPWTLINDLAEQGVTTPRALAERLEVSEVAMSIRLGMPT